MLWRAIPPLRSKREIKRQKRFTSWSQRIRFGGERPGFGEDYKPPPAQEIKPHLDTMLEQLVEPKERPFYETATPEGSVIDLLLVLKLVDQIHND